MIVSLIIGFRETLEAALIIGIIFSYLKKIKRTDYLRFVLYGIIAGILTSILGAIIFSTTKQGFSGRSEQIFEGIAMIWGSIMISSMILWMIHQNKFRQEMEEKIEIEIKDNHKWGMFSLTFISILREGVELVIFLNVSAINDGDYSLLGGFIGILIAIIIGYFLFKGFIRLNLKEF
ncbi:MAG: FTR1 family iron permease, partial [Promethearchaeota archaeon]